MWFIHTVVCIANLTLAPFCSIGGKLPISFDNYETCDKAVDSIVLEIDEQLKEIQLLLNMVTTVEKYTYQTALQ